MKIVFVTNCLASGGSERVISILANSLSERGYDVTVLAMYTPAVFYRLSPEVKYLFSGDASCSKLIVKRFWWLRKYLKHNRPDIIVSFMNRVYCATLLSTIGLNIPIITSERNDPQYAPFYVKCLIKTLIPLTTHHVVQTDAIKAYYSERVQRKTTVIVNPVNDDIFCVPNSEEKRNLIVSVGRLDPQKNQRMMISAFSRIANSHPTWKLVIYGEGPSRGDLESFISEKNLSGKVLLPGRTDKIFYKMVDAKIFCLSSNYEGMSNALIEAICLGLPIVTTNVSGVAELIKNGENGLVVEVGNEEKFMEALNMLVESPEMQQKFSIENKNYIHFFSRKQIVDKWEDLIVTIINKNKSEENRSSTPCI